ncbi:hypothetical protein CKM354_001007800 [Cercospora kikuchii]|uniref:Carrier domain-containing protein n=1 Tax=Cercospora kikuchii TaxID=84275 RepID=A0A9P3CQQ0_9PEZI|nr:uncharacterized protein CKM354_001007800 [Cercospora kikuchii]GIZ46976.1 hypothetical protein CKM354_001007800 [Cercospora kikuchii]
MAAMFPRVAANYIPRTTSSLHHRCQLPSTSKTPASQLPYYIEAAWAHASSIYTGQSAVAYGLVLSGRTSQLGIIGTTLGPTITTIPVQANVNPESTISEFIKERAKERRQAFSHTALQFDPLKIRALSAESRRASQFTTILDISTSSLAGPVNDDVLLNTESQIVSLSALVLRISIQEATIIIDASFDPNVIHERQVRRTLHQLDHSLRLFLEGPADRKLRELATISAEDWREVFEWNDALPHPAQQCIHEFFQDRAQLHASKRAVEAWDRNATYEELDMLSTQLALRLIGFGVAPGDPVLIHYARSCSAVISILAVMKAGGCCVPIQPSQTRSRKETIAAESKAKFVVTANSSEDVHGLVEIIIVADEVLPDEENEAADLPPVPADQLGFILFTSDSTGVPEGVLFEHQSIAISLLALGVELEWGPETRGLQFAPLECAASLGDLLGPLLFGGCIFIPSKDEHDSRLATYITSKRVNYAQLTPSVLRCLSPETCPTLKTIHSLAEAIDPKTAGMWSDVHLSNGWGVDGASMQSSLNMVEANSPYAHAIGRPLGCALWIIEPENEHKLTPIGAVGELLIEGTTVARGYLNKDAKQAASFISPPVWAPLRTAKRRFYRTGDLARFLPGGNIEYLGRKENQVKIRGQRVHLEEVESAILSCGAVREAVVAFQKVGNHKDLVAVLSLDHASLPDGEHLEELNCEASSKTLVTIRVHVKRFLPTQMVPKYWIAVAKLPLTTNAKTDRDAVKEWLESRDLTAGDLTIPYETTSVNEPSSDVEKAFQEVLESVLRKPISKIDLTSSFVDIGGDPISAMQVATRFAKRRYQITILSLLESPSLFELAKGIENAQQVTFVQEERLDEDFDISPFQKLFLQHNNKATNNHLCQYLLFELRSTSSPAEIEAALQRLVRHHPSLRTTFIPYDDGLWKAKVVAANTLHFEHIQGVGESSLTAVVNEVQQSWDVADGPAFGANQITLADGRHLLLLAAHQLSVDAASWTIIRQQLNALLEDSEGELPPGTLFSSWTQHLHTLPSSDAIQEWPQADRHFWGISDQPALHSDRTTVQFQLDNETSGLLLNSANDAFQSTPAELLLAAIWMSFQQSFPDRGGPALYAEGDGRQMAHDDSDLTGTVGCFTVLFPVILASEDSGISTEHIVPAIKKSHRQAFSSAVVSFTQTMFGTKPLLLGDIEILFTFSDKRTQSDGFLELYDPINTLASRCAKESEQVALISINAAVLADGIRFSFDWNNEMAHQDQLRDLVIQLEQYLPQMATQLCNRAPRLTRAEMPLLELDAPEHIEQAIRDLGICPDDVEMVHPVSATQEAVLLAQAKSTDDVYTNQALLRLAPAENHSIDRTRFEQSWKAVCQAHPMLRTIFANGISSTTAFVQIVLREANPTIIHVKSEGNDEYREAEHNLEPTDPSHRLQIRALPDSGEVDVVLEINPALADAAALAMISKDLSNAYASPDNLIEEDSFAKYLVWSREKEEASRAYWTTYLAGLSPGRLPTFASPNTSTITSSTSYIDATFDDVDMMHSFCQRSGVTIVDFVQVAWALVLRRLTGSEDVAFGYLYSGRDVFDGAEEIFGPLLSLLTCRFDLAIDTKVVALLDRAKADLPNSMAHFACSLSSLQDSIGLGSESLFDTALLIQQESPYDSADKEGALLKVIPVAIDEHREHAVTLKVCLERQVMRARLIYQKALVPMQFASEILEVLDNVIWNLAQATDTASVKSIIGDCNNLSNYEIGLIKKWNARAPQVVKGTLHDRFRQIAARNPLAPAIRFGDCEMSYGDLNTLSDHLASELYSRRGVRAEHIVPVLCGKGLEAVIFRLAVIKAGGAFLGLDAELSDERLADMLQILEKPTILAHASAAVRAQTLTSGKVVSHDLQSIEDLPRKSPPSSLVNPDQPAYCTYSSGYSGQPKAVLVRHSNIVTSLVSSMDRLGVTYETRTFQISSLASDVSVIEIFQTLLAGGCLCSPTAQGSIEMMEDQIIQMRANFVHLSPAMAEVMSPARAPSLATVVLRGDVVTTEAVQKWHGNVRLMNCYGTAGGTGITSCIDISTSQISNIGLPFSCRYWVVDSNNHDQLVPIGHPGELLIQGPNVAHGYIKGPTKTSESFIAAPLWTKSLPGFRDTTTQPFYKTGDIVVQNVDGTIEYIDRKDRQLKLSGLPIELGRIDSHLRKHAGSDWHAVAELIHPKRQSEDSFLAAFMVRAGRVTTDPQSSTRDQPLPPLPKIARRLHKTLATALPSYMAPKVYIPVRDLVLNTSGKTDRKRLRFMAEAMTADQILRYNALTLARRNTSMSTRALENSVEMDADKTPPNAAEIKLQQLWSSVLSLPQSSIFSDSEWLSLGGDSLKAMKLASAARDQGLALTVADIFRAPNFKQLSQLAMSRSTENCSIAGKAEIAPFSLLTLPADIAREEAARLCGVHISQIEDMYPCTPLQKALLALSSRHKGAFVRRVKIQLHPQMSVGRLQRAWARLVEETQILRTRIIDIPGQGIMQVVIDEPVCWSTGDSVNLQTVTEMGLGSLLNSPGIQVDSSNATLLWMAHRAVSDQWALPLLLQNLERLYFEEPHQPLDSFHDFVSHVSDVAHDEASVRYWRNQFDGSASLQWPGLASPSYEPLCNSTVEHEIRNICPRSCVTLSTAIRAAWATLISQYTAAYESTFGAVVNGRYANIEGIERVAGPTLATVPIRIIVDPRSSVADLLTRVQQQAIDMIKWEQTGLINIQQCSPEARLASRFQSLLIIQSAEQLSSNVAQNSKIFSGVELVDDPASIGISIFTGCALVLGCEQYDGNLKLRFMFDSDVITGQSVCRIAQQFETILRRLCNSSAAHSRIRMSSIMIAGDNDLTQIWKWNANLPKSVDKCVHHILKPVFAKRAASTALQAWDGTLTYGQLDALTEKLSRHLIELGVRPNTNVPLFFEKSLWCSVAALAVMKAGATSVMMNFALPKDRLQAILKQVKPGLALTSSKQVALAQEMTPVPLMIVDQAHIDEIVLESEEDTFELVRPDDALCVAFTSGSMGPPKGVIITHANFCSALQHQAKATGLTDTSRNLDVSTYGSDMAWYNLFHTLYAGGCLCIPNEDWRTDVSGAVLDLNANFLSTTPAIASSLNAEALRNLDAIETFGEEPSAELVERLQHCVKRYRDVYSTTECTSIALGSSNPLRSSHIGVADGLAPWIVDPSSKELVPIGCVGELWLEGPLLAKGYLNDAEQSSDAFVDAPNWLRNGTSTCAGRQSRVYRTGDLARYEDDGSLSFVGRRDRQLVIRGQRLDLAEVERHVRRCFSTAHQVSADVVVEAIPRPENGDTILTAIVAPRQNRPEDVAYVVEQLVSGINDRLAESLPSYMIPAVFKALAEIPLTSNGKTDRRRTRELAASLPNINKASRSGAVIPPANDTEDALRDICADVLTISHNAISVEANWTQLGGDSVTAMQAAARAKKIGLDLRIEHLIHGHALRDIAGIIDHSHHNCGETTSIDTCSSRAASPATDDFEPAPVQQWCLEEHPTGTKFDVPLYLELESMLSSQNM